MTKQPKPLSEYPLKALIREAPLTTQGKVLLFVIASHHDTTSFAAVKTLLRQTGLKRGTFYKTRTSLKAQGILNVTEKQGAATTYTINKGQLVNLNQAPRVGVSPGGTPSVIPKKTAGVSTSGSPPAATRQSTPAIRRTPRVVRRHQKTNNKTNNQEHNSKSTEQTPESSSSTRIRRVRVPKHVTSPTSHATSTDASEERLNAVRARLAKSKKTLG